MEVKWSDEIAAFSRAEWNSAVRRDAIYLRHEHLSALHASGIDVTRYRYFLFRNGAGTAGVAVAYCIDTPLGVFWPRRLDAGRLLAEPSGRPAGGRRALAVRTVECGMPTAVGQAVSVPDETDAQRVWKALLGAMWDFADEMRCKTMVVRDLSPETAAAAASAGGAGCQQVPFFPNARLRVRWESWEAYLESLRKRYRQRVRGHEAAFAAAGIAREHREQFGDLAEELYRLYVQVYARATELRRERLTPAYFAAIDTELGVRSSVLLYRQRGRLVGFDILFHDDDTLRCLYTGFDYAVNEQARLYFNLYYDDLRMAIARGMKWVEWGLGSYPTKLALGAETTPMRFLLLHRRPAAAYLLKTLFTATQPKQPLPAYRVFRDGGAEEPA